MAQVYFHCSNSEEVWIDRGGTAVGNLAEAHERAVVVVHALIMTHSEEDWRGWVLHVNDDLGIPGLRGACHRAALRADPLAPSGLRLSPTARRPS